MVIALILIPRETVSTIFHLYVVFETISQTAYIGTNECTHNCGFNSSNNKISSFHSNFVHVLGLTEMKIGKPHARNFISRLFSHSQTAFGPRRKCASLQFQPKKTETIKSYDF